jgi:hypothetical protein
MAGVLDLLIAGSSSGDFRFDDLMPPSAAWPLTHDVAHQNHSRVPTQARKLCLDRSNIAKAPGTAGD